MTIRGLHHVQVAMPPGREDDARAFYAGALGLEEITKPENLHSRGGCWFRSADGGAEIHLGVEQDFRPARKAHPAILVDGLAELRRRLVAGGHDVVEDEPLQGFDRCYAFDPFGNRLELLERGAG